MIGVLSCDTPPPVKNGDAGGKSYNFLPAITGVQVISKLFWAPPLLFSSAETSLNLKLDNSKILSSDISILNQGCSSAWAAVNRSFGSFFKSPIARSFASHEILSQNRGGNSSSQFWFLVKISLTLSPLNKGRPVNITYIITPAENTSA